MFAWSSNLIVAAVAVVLAVSVSVVDAQGKPTSLSIVHVNDHHSHFDTTSLNVYAPLIPELSVNTSHIRLYYGGFARMITVLNAMEQSAMDAGRETLRVHGGDMISGTIYYSALGYAPDAAAMNAAKFEAVTIGNHEFDGGDTNLANLLNTLNSTIILSANLVPSPTSALRSLTGIHAYQPYFVKTLSNGEKLGVCGITLSATPQEDSSDPGTYFLDEATTAKNCVAQLEALGVNKIVMLTHIGYDSDLSKITPIPGVDVIVGAHSHTLLADSSYDQFGLPVQGPYAAMTNGVCVVQAWCYSQAAGRIDVEFDANGVVTSCSGSAKLPLDPDNYQVRDASPTYYLNASDAAILTKYYSSYPPFAVAEEEPTVAAAIAPFRAKIAPAVAKVVVNVTENLCLTYEPGNICPDRPLSTFLGGGVCYLVAQSYLYQAPTADFAVQNRGGCRIPIEQGPFTISDAYTVLPFGDILVTLKVTGDEFRQAMEDSLDFQISDGGSALTYYLESFSAGIRFSVDFTKPYGTRYSNIEVNSGLRGSWVPLDLGATYTLATTDYLAAGHDNYLAFNRTNLNDPTMYTDTFTVDAQCLINYAEHLGSLSDPPLDQFSYQSVILANGTSYYNPRYPVCKICPSSIPNPQGLLDVPGQLPTSCADVQTSGMMGQISPTVCSSLKASAPSVCGCSSCQDTPGNVIKVGRVRGRVPCSFLTSHPREKRSGCARFGYVCPVTCNRCPKNGN